MDIRNIHSICKCTCLSENLPEKKKAHESQLVKGISKESCTCWQFVGESQLVYCHLDASRLQRTSVIYRNSTMYMITSPYVYTLLINKVRGILYVDSWQKQTEGDTYFSRSSSTMLSMPFSWQNNRTRCWLTTGWSAANWDPDPEPEGVATPIPQSISSCLLVKVKNDFIKAFDW